MEKIKVSRTQFNVATFYVMFGDCLISFNWAKQSGNLYNRKIFIVEDNGTDLFKYYWYLKENERSMFYRKNSEPFVM